MSRRTRIGWPLTLALLAGSAGSGPLTGPVSVAAQAGGQAERAPAQAPAPATRPALLFREAWTRSLAAAGQPTSPHRSANQYVLANQMAVSAPNLQLTLYGEKARDLTVYEHEGRIDLWTGLVGSPIAVTLKDRANYLDLTGLARLRAIVRTSNLHALHPVVKLADGTLAVGSQRIDTGGAFLSVEVAYDNQRWFVLDPTEVSVGRTLENPDLSRVDELGFVNLAPSGGHGNSGWANISTVEVFATATKR
ncbi:MAG: hypothetical protein AB7G23_00910 [Vicinamibacterales bacterium]